MCSNCTAFVPVSMVEWNPPVIPSVTGVTTVTIQGLVGTWPPPVCTGTGWQPAGVQSNPHWSPGQYRCGVCGQMVEVDGYGRLTLHPYLKVA